MEEQRYKLGDQHVPQATAFPKRNQLPWCAFLHVLLFVFYLRSSFHYMHFGECYKIQDGKNFREMRKKIIILFLFIIFQSDHNKYCTMKRVCWKMIKTMIRPVPHCLPYDCTMEWSSGITGNWCIVGSNVYFHFWATNQLIYNDNVSCFNIALVRFLKRKNAYCLRFLWHLLLKIAEDLNLDHIIGMTPARCSAVGIAVAAPFWPHSKCSFWYEIFNRIKLLLYIMRPAHVYISSIWFKYIW